MLFFLYTFSERIAWSDCGKGGWLIFCIYEVFKQLLDTNYSISLLHILTDVCGKMSKDMETRTPSTPAYDCSKSAATIYHMLTKDIFLKPVSHQMVPKPDPVLETSVWILEKFLVDVQCFKIIFIVYMFCWHFANLIDLKVNKFYAYGYKLYCFNIQWNINYDIWMAEIVNPLYG